MKNLYTFEEFVNESIDEDLNEGDMTKDYDGFILLDMRNKRQFKFFYERGVNNVKVEDAAIQKLMNFTKLPRSNFAVHGFIKRGKWDKDDSIEFTSKRR